MKKAVIIGCGLAGLGAAEIFRKNDISFEIIEKEERPGGLCRTEKEGEYYFDYTGHLLHFRNETFSKIVFDIIGNKLIKKNRSAWIFYKNTYTKYPFQANLYGLPIEIVVECVYEYSKRFFSEEKSEINNFEEWIKYHFGDGIANHFMIPYNSKIYKKDLKELSPDCGGRFVPKSDLKLLLRGAITDNNVDLGYNSVFYYPEKDGIESLINALSNNITVNVNEEVIRIRPQFKTIITSKGREIHYDALISTQPVDQLIKEIENTNDIVLDASRKLKHVSVLNVNIGIKGDVSEKHWIYVPENEYTYHRLGFTNKFSEKMAPKGYSSIYLEISYDPNKGIDKENVKLKSIENLIKMGIIKEKQEIDIVNIIDIPYAYVIFDHDRKKSLNIIKNYLNEIGIISAGRFGSWEYSSMEDAFMDGRNAAQNALSFMRKK